PFSASALPLPLREPVTPGWYGNQRRQRVCSAAAQAAGGAQEITQAGHELGGGGVDQRLALAAIADGRPAERLAEDDRHIGPARAAGPPGPGLVRAGDGGRHHRYTGPKDQPDGAASGRLEPAVPAPLTLDVNSDALPLLEPAQRMAHGLRVDLEAPDRKGMEPRHEPAHGRAEELGALGHGVEHPGADGLDEDRIQDALMVGDQQERPRGRDVLHALHVEAAAHDGPAGPDQRLAATVQAAHRSEIRGWNSAISPHPARRYRRRRAAWIVSSHRRTEASGKRNSTTGPPRIRSWSPLELGCTAATASRGHRWACPSPGAKVKARLVRASVPRTAG